MRHFVHFDIMIRGRFVCTMHMPHCPAFKLSIQELRQFVETRRPSLIGKTYDVYFD